MNIELSTMLQEVKNNSALKNLTKEDLEKIAKKASNTFSGTLSAEEIQSCILNAFWKAVEKYTGDKNCKFTTYFYKGIIMECLSQKKFNFNKSPSRIYEGIASRPNNDVARIDMMDEINTYCDDPQIIYNRFYKNMSISEIASNMGVCSETIRLKIKKNLSKLKQSMSTFGV